MIRTASPADAAALAEIYNHYIDHSVATFEETRINAADMAGRMAAVASFGLPWVVAEREDELLGYAYANRWRERSAYRYSVEVTVYLKPGCTGAGWGQSLYGELFARLRKGGVHVAVAGITLPNAASVALHEKLGMRKVAHFEEVGFKQEQWLDVGYWQINLAGVVRGATTSIQN